MNSTKLRILEILSQGPTGLGGPSEGAIGPTGLAGSSEPQSISDLARALKTLHGSAYYKNVYDTVRDLEAEGLISIRSAGRTSLVSLDFGNPETTLLLSIIEIEKKRSFLKEEPGELDIIRSLEAISGLTILIHPQENLKLNLLEILYLADEGHARILSELKELEKKYNRRIAPLILTAEEFKKGLESAERNIIKDVLRDCIILSDPESFWRVIENAAVKDASALGKFEEIKEGELRYNLARFGYSGFGDEKLEGRKINLESIIIACLLKKEARLTEAIPVLLAKNAVNYRLLLHLAIKYGLTCMMGFLMETAAELSKKQGIQQALALFEMYRKPAASNTGNPIAKRWGISTRNTLNDFKKTMELYNAT